MGYAEGYSRRSLPTASYLPRTALCLLIAAAFFAASLTPSLMPRGPVVQGALAGSVAIIGYGIGHLLRWLWLFLDIPQPFKAWHSRFRLAACAPGTRRRR